MLPPNFTIRDDFPAVSYDQWRSLAEADLHGVPFEKKLVTHTYEAIDIQPLYTRRDQPDGGDAYGFPGLPPFVRGAQPIGNVRSGWDLQQEYAHPDLTNANRTILDDLAGGVTSLLLRFDQAARSGYDPDDPKAADHSGHDGLMAYTLDDLDRALAGVRVDAIGISLEAGASFLPAAALLAALWQRRKVAPAQARGAFNADPLSALAHRGHLPYPAVTGHAQLADLAKWTAKTYPQVTAVGVGTAAYHHAGATAAQDVAFAVATGVEYLRAMAAAEMKIDAAARQILFNLSIGTHHFLAIAKLRAARLLWSRIIEASGGSMPAGAMRIHARISRRVLTTRDPYVNLLRNTVCVFAAAVGGAESITSLPFDATAEVPSEASRRIARNTVFILQEEAHLHRVIDPAGGSWFLDSLTQQLAEKAWQIFQDIERQGGMLPALQSGWIAGQINAAFAPRAKNIARRKEGITGVSEFPNVHEPPMVSPPVDHDALRSAAANRVSASRPKKLESLNLQLSNESTAEAVKAASEGASVGQLARAIGFHQSACQCAPIEPHVFSEPFESLRDAVDAWQSKHGSRPTVFLANMGPAAQHTARATFSKNFFEAGGFEVLTNEGFKDPAAAAKAFAQSGASVAVICSSDKLSPDLVPQLAGALKSAGAKTVVLAGNPGQNDQPWRAAGVDRFIFIQCDVVKTLQEMLQQQGVFNAANIH